MAVLSQFFHHIPSDHIDCKLNNYITNLDSTNAKEPGGQPSFHSNVVSRKGFWGLFNRRTNWQNMPDRQILAQVRDEEIGPNKISTSKYGLLTFLPKNLLEQFSKLANLYFLVCLTHRQQLLKGFVKFIGILQIISAISISNGQPVIYMPLAVILMISAIKDLFEDLKRHKSDKEENTRKVQVIRDGSLIDTVWADIMVGEVIRVFPLFSFDFTEAEGE